MSRKNRNRQVNQSTEELENNPIVSEEDSTEEFETEDENSFDQQEEQVGLVQEEQQPSVSAEQIVEVKEEPSSIIEEEVEVKKPVPNKGVLIVERKPITPVAKSTVSATVEKFNSMADQYIDLMKNEVIGEEERRKAVLLLTAIGNYVITSTDNKVFEACYSFFLKNRSIMLVVERVTDGLYKYADKAKVTKLVQWYITFQSLVESKLLKTNFTLNLTTIRRTFNNDALANWLIIKKK